ncbi:MAG: glutaredoxin domain-containing protein [Acidimicrobiia bacterium]|nr:glutaredoxin domain-containing protein [Acidimicrobiia bacterium]
MTAQTIDYYWRPGCPFCMSLERSLEKLNLPLNKLNIWDDPAHAEAVRRIANGNETVPTVVIGDAQLVNPSADQVVQALANQAPDLLPEGIDIPSPGKMSRRLNKLLGG